MALHAASPWVGHSTGLPKKGRVPAPELEQEIDFAEFEVLAPVEPQHPEHPQSKPGMDEHGVNHGCTMPPHPQPHPIPGSSKPRGSKSKSEKKPRTCKNEGGGEGAGEGQGAGLLVAPQPPPAASLFPWREGKVAPGYPSWPKEAEERWSRKQLAKAAHCAAHLGVSGWLEQPSQA